MKSHCRISLAISPFVWLALIVFADEVKSLNVRRVRSSVGLGTGEWNAPQKGQRGLKTGGGAGGVADEDEETRYSDTPTDFPDEGLLPDMDIMNITVATEGPTTPEPTTEVPTLYPSELPSDVPSQLPTTSPTDAPTATPTILPTVSPTLSPTVSPTQQPTVSPTQQPSLAPSIVSSNASSTASPVNATEGASEGGIDGCDDARKYSDNKACKESDSIEDGQYECPRFEDDEMIEIASPSAGETQYAEGNLTQPGDRNMWYSPNDYGMCTVLAEPDAALGLVPRLCKKFLVWPSESDYPNSTLVMEGIVNFDASDMNMGAGYLTITGGTGCFSGVSGVSYHTRVGNSFVENIRLEL